MIQKTYWNQLLERFKAKRAGLIALTVIGLFVFIAIYAPFFASSKPIVVIYKQTIYFPLFRYLLSSSFFSKKIDIFFNVLALALPLFCATFLLKQRSRLFSRVVLGLLFVFCFGFFGFFKVLDPAVSAYLNTQREALYLKINSSGIDTEKGERATYPLPSWDFELKFLNDYAKLNLVLAERSLEKQDEKIKRALGNSDKLPQTLYAMKKEREERDKINLHIKIKAGKAQYETDLQEEALLRGQVNDPMVFVTEKNQQRFMRLEEANEDFEELQNRLSYLEDKNIWLEQNQKDLSFVLMPLICQHHWEDDVGGSQALNLQLPFMELSRINRKHLVSALIFGSRISLFVGFTATFLALAIGVPLGLLSGYFGSRLDMLLCRFVEVWEAMPVFFMLLLIVALLQTKSIFVVIAVLSLFSWMSAFRFVRAETFRQREMLYVDAAKALGFTNFRILLFHVLPNSLLVVLALLPFDIMAAVTREAALAFLGLGEEQSCSWGVLMDEGRSAFPAESNLLWPPSIVLTVLLVAIAFVGQTLQEAMDPKSSRST